MDCWNFDITDYGISPLSGKFECGWPQPAVLLFLPVQNVIVGENVFSLKGNEHVF